MVKSLKSLLDEMSDPTVKAAQNMLSAPMSAWLGTLPTQPQVVDPGLTNFQPTIGPQMFPTDPGAGTEDIRDQVLKLLAAGPGVSLNATSPTAPINGEVPGVAAPLPVGARGNPGQSLAPANTKGAATTAKSPAMQNLINSIDKHLDKMNIPQSVRPVFYAQVGLETSQGTSYNVQKRNNIAGIGGRNNYKVYPNLDAGAADWADLLARKYPNVVKAAKSGDITATAKALGDSPWAAHHYRLGASGDEYNGGAGIVGTEGQALLNFAKQQGWINKDGSIKNNVKPDVVKMLKASGMTTGR